MKRTGLLVGTALLSLTLAGAARADGPIRPGQEVSVDATVCATEKSALSIADAARRTGTGYSAYMALKKAGECSSAMASGTVEKVITEFDDSRIGHTRLVQIRVEADGRHGVVFGLIGDEEGTPGASSI